jgi:hypothetical protein
LTATRVGVFAVPSGRYLRSFAVRFPHAPARFVVRPRDVDRRGRLVVWGDPENGPDDRLGLVDPTSGRLVAQARLGDIAFLFGLGWSHDGRWLGLATFNRNVILLDARTLRIRARVAAAQQGSLRSVSFSPDDTTLVAGSDDGSLNFWNVPDLSAGPGPIVLGHGTAFAWFSPTGRIVGLAPDPARPGRERWFVLAADPASLANAACGLAGGGLTPAQWRRYAVAESYRPTCPAVR